MRRRRRKQFRFNLLTAIYTLKNIALVFFFVKFLAYLVFIIILLIIDALNWITICLLLFLCLLCTLYYCWFRRWFIKWKWLGLIKGKNVFRLLILIVSVGIRHVSHHWGDDVNRFLNILSTDNIFIWHLYLLIASIWVMVPDE